VSLAWATLPPTGSANSVGGDGWMIFDSASEQAFGFVLNLVLDVQEPGYLVGVSRPSHKRNHIPPAVAQVRRRAR